MPLGWRRLEVDSPSEAAFDPSIFSVRTDLGPGPPFVELSGFGVYLAATTALGFATHAVGITLPFAIYTGLTSTIAVLIGQVGWLGAGLWAGLKVTEPDWQRLGAGVLYMGSTMARREFASQA